MCFEQDVENYSGISVNFDDKLVSMNIKIVCVGKLKEKYFKDAIAEYKKRLSRFAKVSIVQVPDEKAPEKFSAAEDERVKQIEGERILSKIKDKEYVYVTAIKGKQRSSEEFAKEIQDLATYGHSDITFVIGDKEFEEAIENGTDPSPKTINKMTNEIKDKKIAFFVNNTQASSSTVKTFVKLAKENGVPVLNVRETIPNHMTYLDWMRENYQNLANISKK